MDRESEYAAFAEQAERLSQQSASLGIARSWQLLAQGFRRLADLHDAARRFWCERADGPMAMNQTDRPGCRE
jgi:hypothetical protein